MAQVEVLKRGSMWYVYRDNAVVGRYKSPQEANAITETAYTSKEWPPVTNEPGVSWSGGRWRLSHGEAYVSLDQAVEAHKRLTAAAQTAQAKKQQEDGCKKCVWRLVICGSRDGEKILHCGYSLVITHHSRLWLHYQ